jgi:predicted RNase H-like nuclease (RuvC/YqgF family)
VAPNTRSSIKFQQTASGEWRVIEGSESRKVTTEEMKAFAAWQSSLKQELERVMQEAKEKEKLLEKLGEELEQMRQAVPQKETIADQEVGEGISAASTEAALNQKLTPLTELLSRLTRKVEQMSEGNSVDDVAYGREQAVEGRNGHSTADRRGEVGMAGESSYVREVDGWGGMGIGEANRIHKENLSAVAVTKTGDANFASARACWARLTVQYPVSPVHQPKLVAHAFEGAAATVFQKTAAANRDANARKLWDLMQRRLYNTA